MKFNSIGASNAGNYAGAGKAVADSAARVFDVQRKTGPDYAKISQTAMVTQAEEKITAMKTAAQVTEQGIKNLRDKTILQHGIAVKNDKIQRAKSKRKAGVIAGLGRIGGAAFLASRDNTKGREYPSADFEGFFKKWKEQRDGIKSRQDSERTALGEFTPAPVEFDTPSFGGNSGKVTGGGTETSPVSPQKSSVSPQSFLSGNQRIVADAIAKYESGDWGYEAFNQGGRAGGTRVVGKSGNHKQTFGRSLTDMTLNEIFHKQNTAQRGLSFQQHLDQGGLHAVGRYQFIGSTLQDEVRRMGIDPNTKFTPDIQDQIFLSHIKRVGDISPWVGPSNNYNASQKANFRNMISQF